MSHLGGYVIHFVMKSEIVLAKQLVLYNCELISDFATTFNT